MDEKRIDEIIKRMKKEQAKKYYMIINKIIKNNPKEYEDKDYAQYFLKLSK